MESKNKKIKKKAKPFFKIGFVILTITIICLAVVNYLPWMYIRHSSSSQSDFIERSYYKDFKTQEDGNESKILDFFNSKNSSLYLGLNKNDFSLIPNISNHICYILVILSLIFVTLVILDKKIDFSLKKLLVFQTLITSIIIIVFLYTIYILVQFLGANILSFTNISILKTFFPDLALIFPAPLIIISLLAVSLKICFTVIKSNYNEMFKLSDANQ